MSAPIVFLDTETTGLDPIQDQIWEFAAVRREPSGNEAELHLLIEHSWTLCGRLPEMFRSDHEARYEHQLEDNTQRQLLPPGAHTRQQAANLIEQFLGNHGSGRPHIVGAVPNFDTERLQHMFRLLGSNLTWGAHYHLIDVENLAVGYLAARIQASPQLEVLPGRFSDSRPDLLRTLTPPWDSDWLSMAVGVDPQRFDRHTAMGDVRWAMAIYDQVMGISR